MSTCRYAHNSATNPTPEEEVANALTHGMGVVLSILSLFFLILKALFDAPEAIRIPSLIGFSIFGLSLIFLYGMSTVYHSLHEGRLKDVFQVLDHLAIYILIAGSYSAYCLSALYESIGLRMFCVIWGLALTGVVSQLIWGKKFKIYSLILYLAMGWLIILEVRTVLEIIPTATFWYILGGGLAYTIGFVFYALQRIKWMHTVWHFFVLFGSAFHVVAAFSII
ncbi:MAG: hemolysin III family protein [Planctomycetia bacterium]|nr:hemolysin III family protein [Planctomycetia bacterium]